MFMRVSAWLKESKGPGCENVEIKLPIPGGSINMIVVQQPTSNSEKHEDVVQDMLVSSSATCQIMLAQVILAGNPKHKLEIRLCMHGQWTM
jgi:hypothetical protein